MTGSALDSAVHNKANKDWLLDLTAEEKKKKKVIMVEKLLFGLTSERHHSRLRAYIQTKQHLT